jgi:hypothetical protein
MKKYVVIEFTLKFLLGIALIALAGLLWGLFEYGATCGKIQVSDKLHKSHLNINC